MLLYRPVGLGELRLIAEANFARFPPRLPDQPIFYPVVTLEYARKIARDWNPTDTQSGYIGFVTRFEIDTEAAARYPVQSAGGSAHKELWVPSDEVAEFNRHIIGPITIVDFADAVAVLEDPYALTRDDPHQREKRFVPLGLDALGRLVVVSWTYRQDDSRIISARRATRSEARSYPDEG